MNPYEKMKQYSVSSMSQGELLVLLYDELLKDLKKAEFALDDAEYDIFDKQIDYCQRIVRYLSSTLVMDQPISNDLQRLYDYLLFDFGRCRAARERRKSELPALEGIIKDLRDGFYGASREVVDTHTPEDRRVVV